MTFQLESAEIDWQPGLRVPLRDWLPVLEKTVDPSSLVGLPRSEAMWLFFKPRKKFSLENLK
jgi:hypothetical protein